MTKKITYIATDGKEFATEKDCQDYESVINNSFAGFTFFDFDRTILNKNRAIFDVISETQYFYVDENLNANQLIYNLNKIAEYDPMFEFEEVPTKLLCGLWFFDDGEWKSYNEIKSYYDDIEKKLKMKI